MNLFTITFLIQFQNKTDNFYFKTNLRSLYKSNSISSLAETPRHP